MKTQTGELVRGWSRFKSEYFEPKNNGRGGATLNLEYFEPKSKGGVEPLQIWYVSNLKAMGGKIPKP